MGMIPHSKGLDSKHACTSRAHDARLRGDDALGDIVAMVERMAAEKRSTRQIVEAVRAYAADRAPAPVATPLIWIDSGSPEWRAWAAFWRATKGKTPPVDKRGGWRFPSRWPP